MRITLVVPGLLAIPPAVLSQVAALGRLAALATVTQVRDLDTATLAALGTDAAPAPLAALGAAVDVGGAWVIRADPVATTVGRQDVRVDGCAFDLDASERADLVGLLDAHFAGDGLAFVAPRADAWFALSATPHAIETTPVDAIVDRPLRALLPSGPDAARWRLWLTEIQMLLHEHALSRRAGRSVDAVWFSGGGVLPEAAAIPAFEGCACDGRYGDVLRGAARVAQRTVASIVPLDALMAKRSSDRFLVALPGIRSPVELAALGRDFLAPALAALDRGNASAVELIASGNATAASWSARRPSWLARVRRRHAPFTVPEFS